MLCNSKIDLGSILVPATPSHQCRRRLGIFLILALLAMMRISGRTESSLCVLEQLLGMGQRQHRLGGWDTSQSTRQKKTSNISILILFVSLIFIRSLLETTNISIFISLSVCVEIATALLLKQSDFYARKSFFQLCDHLSPLIALEH